jgi:peptide/nickel transport system permease protein
MNLQTLDKRIKPKRNSYWAITWEQFRRHKLAVIGLCILIIEILIAIFANQIMTYNPLKVNLAYAMGLPKPPNAQHWFGTDQAGRDWFSRALAGSRVSLSIGFISVGIATIIGVTLGSIAGFFGGWGDNVIMRLADIFMSLPIFYLMIIANSFLPPSIYNVMFVIGVFGWMGIARLIRGEFLRLSNMDFITAARAIGVPRKRMILRHFIPNSLAPVIVAVTMGIPSAILSESALSFLGFGVQPPYASWGNMLLDGKMWLRQAWWLWLIPGLLIALTVISFNFFGDGLRDAIDPIERGRG